MRNDDHSDNDLPRPSEPPVVAHPLAHLLVTKLAGCGGRARIVGIGSGRNLAPFLAAGIGVDVLESDPERADAIRARYGAAVPVVRAAYDETPAAGERGAYAGVLATHALLHGTSRTHAAAIAGVRASLAADGILCATFGSTRDPRASRGERLDRMTTVERDGPEANVPHVFHDRATLGAALRDFTIVDAYEASAAESAGRWAHDARDAETIVHWFVTAAAA